MAAWESRATEAAAGAVNEIVGFARKDAAQETQVGDTLKNLLGFVGVSAAGAIPATSDPARALDLGLGEILLDRFSTSVDEKSYRTLAANTLVPVIKAEASFNNRHGIAAALNTFYHIDINVRGVKANARGVVIPGTPYVNFRTIGMTKTQLLQSEFLHPARENKPDSSTQYRALPGEAQLVLVEMGADCDHAQTKPRSIRYLVGFEVPKKFKDFLIRKGKTAAPPLHSSAHGASTARKSISSFLRGVLSLGNMPNPQKAA